MIFFQVVVMTILVLITIPLLRALIKVRSHIMKINKIRIEVGSDSREDFEGEFLFGAIGIHLLFTSFIPFAHGEANISTLILMLCLTTILIVFSSAFVLSEISVDKDVRNSQYRIETFFWNKSGDNLGKFRSIFDFSPIEKSKSRSMPIKQDADLKRLTRIAKIYHEYWRLCDLKKGLPDYEELSDEDKILYQMNDETLVLLRKELTNEVSTVKEMVKFDKNGDERFDEKQRKHLTELRKMPSARNLNTHSSHPALAILTEIKVNPRVSSEQKAEAEMLESQVRAVMEENNSIFDIFDINEITQSHLDAVRLHFHIPKENA